MNLLSPEQLAEIQQRHGEYAHIEETQGYSAWENKQSEIDRRALLDHIEAREQQVKAELQALRRKPVPEPSGWEMGEFAAGQNREKDDVNDDLDDAAARLGIALD